MDKMTINKQDLLARIQQLEKQQEGIAAELKDLSGMVKNLPDTNRQGLHFENGETVYFVDTDGNVCEQQYHPEIFWETAQNNRVFRSREMAELFAEKTQFIADSLMWKELYDRDYVPDWYMSKRNWAIVFNHDSEKYEVVGHTNWEFTNVCFSSEEIAQGLADWLNSRKRESNESSVTV